MSREQQAAELRSRITGTDPDLLTVIDGLKECFGASLRHIKLGEFELGKDSLKEGGIVPAPSPNFGLAGKSLKEAEQAHITRALEARAAARGRAVPRRRSGVA